MTVVSHKMAKIGYARVSSFPYPLEVIGDSNKVRRKRKWLLLRFPYPLEKTGGYYQVAKLQEEY